MDRITTKRSKKRELQGQRRAVRKQRKAGDAPDTGEVPASAQLVEKKPWYVRLNRKDAREPETKIVLALSHKHAHAVLVESMRAVEFYKTTSNIPVKYSVTAREAR